MKTILVVDDEARIVSLIKAYLEKNSYRVLSASNGREALFVARENPPDLIILDIMMPEMDGQDFMRIYHREKDTPIILLTAKIEENEKIIGLELGADDYVTKPFSPRELLARVKAVLRRSEKGEPGAAPAPRLEIGDLVIDQERYLVFLAGERIDVTRVEFDLLKVLMCHPGRAFTRAELIERVQGTQFQGYDRTIDVHIKNLRSKIEDNPRNPRYIETVYGVGYRCATE